MWKIFLGVLWAFLFVGSVGALVLGFIGRNFLYSCNLECYFINPSFFVVISSAVVFVLGAAFALWRPEIKAKVALFFILLPLLPLAGLAILLARIFLFR
jgi:hypothetical protein